MADEWEVDSVVPAEGSVSKAEFRSIMNKTFGPGKWAPTSAFRTPAQEDALRRQGAGTVKPGHVSSHSEGTEDAPGAYDFVVPGMSQADAARRLASADKRFAKVFAERAQGGQGEHVHATVGLAPDDEWAVESVTPDKAAMPKGRDEVTAANRGPVTNADIRRRLGMPPSDLDTRTRGQLSNLDRTLADVKAHPKDPVNALKVLGGVADLATNAPAIPLAAAVDKPVRAVIDTVNKTFGTHYDPHHVTDTLLAGAGMLTGGSEEAAVAKGARTEANLLKAAQKSPEAGLYHTNVQKLKSEGIYLTPGQEVGGEKVRTESAQKSNPYFSEARRADENKSLASFGEAVYNRVLSDIGQKVAPGTYPGRQALTDVEHRVSTVYEQAKPGIMVKMDKPTTKAIAEAVKNIEVSGSDAQTGLQSFIRQNIAPRLKGGQLDGQGYIDVKSILSAKIRGLRNDPSHKVQEEASYYEDVLGAIMDSADRHSAPESRALLKRADASWAKLMRVQEASGRRIDSQGQFSPGDLQFSVRHQSASRGRRFPAFVKGDALLQDLAEPALAVLPDRTPASDTAEKVQRNNRGVVGAVIGSQIGGLPGAIVGGAADSAVSPVTNAGLNMLLRHRASTRNPATAIAGVERRVSPMIPHNTLRALTAGSQAVSNQQP